MIQFDIRYHVEGYIEGPFDGDGVGRRGHYVGQHGFEDGSGRWHEMEFMNGGKDGGEGGEAQLDPVGCKATDAGSDVMNIPGRGPVASPTQRRARHQRRNHPQEDGYLCLSPGVFEPRGGSCRERERERAFSGGCWWNVLILVNHAVT